MCSSVMSSNCLNQQDDDIKESIFHSLPLTEFSKTRDFTLLSGESDPHMLIAHQQITKRSWICLLKFTMKLHGSHQPLDNTHYR